MIIQIAILFMISLGVFVLSPFWLNSTSMLYKPPFSQEKEKWDRQKEVLLKQMVVLEQKNELSMELTKDEEDKITLLKTQYIDLLKREDRWQKETS